MQVALVASARPVARPTYVWLAIALELVTALGAVPVGIEFLLDPSGKAIGIPQGWIEATVFGNYVIPGLYLLFVNGFGMLLLAVLSMRRQWIAPWLTGTLGVGLIIWILVEVLVMPETMILTWVFLGFGVAMGFVALFWLRETRQLRLW